MFEPIDCAGCGGAGYVSTGIDEMPTERCKRCGGLGTVQKKTAETAHGMDEWKEIKNGQPMPPLDHDVLIWTGQAETPRMFVASRKKWPNGHRGWYMGHEDDLGFRGVTHWRERPDSPSIKEVQP